MEALKNLLLRYRYAAVILLLGLGLMLLPSGKTKSPEPMEATRQQALSRELEQILSSVEGAGRVRVLLTEQTGPEIHYQTDRRSDSSDSGESLQQDTVLVDGEDRKKTGLVRRRDPPRYLGAVVASQGADSPRVRLTLIRAVQCATGLRTDQIQVVRMK